MRKAGNSRPLIGYIPALDGARAVAVALVMAYHLDIGVLRGGFLGVDLFFVLSGFLITTLLLREFSRSARIDLAAFWMRRARRLLPALFVLLGAIALSAASFSPYERGGLRWDLLSALSYVANWRFIAAGQSYFAQFAAPSPVRHLWSLAIEEQFYLLWPLICLGALWLAKHWRAGAATMIRVLILSTFASILALALTFDRSDPSLAYFATYTRAHELLIGAAGAVLIERFDWVRHAVRRMAPSLALVGLTTVLGFGLLMPDTSSAYYFGGSAVFALGALALILGISVHGRTNPVARVLSFRPLTWIGAISYGLYLWHWPVFTWLTTESTGLTGTSLAGARVLITLLIATASFVLVETPIRRGRIGRWRIGLRVTVVGATAAALLLAGITVVQTRGGRPIPEFVSNNRKLIVSDTPDPRGTWGLVGDSTAMALYPGLAVEAARRSERLVVAAFPGCPVGSAVRVDANGQPFAFAGRCPEAVIQGHESLSASFDPAVIFWLSERDGLSIGDGDATLEAGSPGWTAASFADWDQRLETLTARGARIVLILPIHREGADPKDPGGRNPLRQVYRQWAKLHGDRVILLDPDPVVCPAGPCPSRIGNLDLYADGVHISPDASPLVAKELLDLLPSDALQD